MWKPVQGTVQQIKNLFGNTGHQKGSPKKAEPTEAEEAQCLPSATALQRSQTSEPH